MSFANTGGKVTGLGGQIGNKNAFGSANFGGKNFSFGLPWENMKNAAEAQNDWINAAAEARAQGYNNAIDNWKTTFAPYQGFGGDAVKRWNSLLSDPSSITSNPGYAFRLKQGQDTLENSAAARGGLLSGNALRGITEYGQDYASNEYDKALARNQNAAQFGATVDTNYANALGNLNVGLGQSNAQKYGDLSNYAFWQEQQGMDEAKQWLGSLRGMVMGGGMGGNSGGSKNTQPSVMGNQNTNTNSGNNSNNSFLSYYSNGGNNYQGNQYPTNSNGNIDWNQYLSKGSMYLNT